MNFQEMSKYGRVKNLRLVRHIGKILFYALRLSHYYGALLFLALNKHIVF